MKETTMTTKQYTAEDFAEASFARHPDGRIAARFDGGDSVPWVTDDGAWFSDENMADRGWVPVREAAQPITLDALNAAWEGAEEGHATKGDVIIRRAWDGEDFAVWVSVASGWTEEGVRILRRAPKPKRPEGAEELITVMRAMPMEIDVDGDTLMTLADWLAERGVRVTEEGEE